MDLKELDPRKQQNEAFSNKVNKDNGCSYWIVVIQTKKAVKWSLEESCMLFFWTTEFKCETICSRGNLYQKSVKMLFNKTSIKSLFNKTFIKY